jgi:hypothetical protein
VSKPAASRAASTEVEAAVGGSMRVGPDWMLGQQHGTDDSTTNAVEEILCEMLVEAMEEAEIRFRVEERR